MTAPLGRGAVGLAGGDLLFLAVCVGAMLAGLLLAGCNDDDKSATPHVTVRGQRWYVDLATTARQRWIGLSGRKHLPDNAGMLFIFPDSDLRAFCMRECWIPIDIAYLDSDRRVVRMHTMQVEPDRAGRVGYSSDRPAQYVLEVAAGTLAQAGVTVGDVVEFSPGIPPAAKAEPDGRR